MRRRPSLGLFIGLVLTFCGASAASAACVVPNTITNGQVSDATPVMGNFNSLAACANSLAAGSTNAVQINAGSGAFAGVGPLTNGQVLVGSTGAAPVPATITAGAGISVTNGAGSITINATGGAGGAITLISEIVTSGSQTSVTFSSIPNTYRDLIVRIRGRSTFANPNSLVDCQVNGDTGANYNFETSRAYNTSTLFTSSTAQTSFTVGEIPGSTATANYSGVVEVLFGDYPGTTFFKPFKGTWGDPTSTSGTAIGAGIYGGNWLSTAAITSLKFFPNSGNFVDGTVISLYGSM